MDLQSSAAVAVVAGQIRLRIHLVAVVVEHRMERTGLVLAAEELQMDLQSSVVAEALVVVVEHRMDLQSSVVVVVVLAVVVELQMDLRSSVAEALVVVVVVADQIHQNLLVVAEERQMELIELV